MTCTNNIIRAKKTSSEIRPRRCVEQGRLNAGRTGVSPVYLTKEEAFTAFTKGSTSRFYRVRPGSTHLRATA